MGGGEKARRNVKLGVATFSALAAAGACLAWGSGQSSALFPALAAVATLAVGESEGGSAPSAETEATAPRGHIYYPYIDDAGTVRFAASLEQVPPAWRDRAGQVEMATPPPSTPAEAAEARNARTRQLRAATTPASDVRPASAARADDVILYGTRSCGACKLARAHLARRGIAFQDLDVERDADALGEYLAKSGGRPGVPVLDIGGAILQGYDARRMDELLDAL